MSGINQDAMGQMAEHFHGQGFNAHLGELAQAGQHQIDAMAQLGAMAGMGPAALGIGGGLAGASPLQNHMEWGLQDRDAHLRDRLKKSEERVAHLKRDLTDRPFIPLETDLYRTVKRDIQQKRSRDIRGFAQDPSYGEVWGELERAYQADRGDLQADMRQCHEDAKARVEAESRLGWRGRRRARKHQKWVDRVKAKELARIRRTRRQLNKRDRKAAHRASRRAHREARKEQRRVRWFCLMTWRPWPISWLCRWEQARHDDMWRERRLESAWWRYKATGELAKPTEFWAGGKQVTG